MAYVLTIIIFVGLGFIIGFGFGYVIRDYDNK